jgi:hypothetical protein
MIGFFSDEITPISFSIKPNLSGEIEAVGYLY